MGGCREGLAIQVRLRTYCGKLRVGGVGVEGEEEHDRSCRNLSARKNVGKHKLEA